MPILSIISTVSVSCVRMGVARVGCETEPCMFCDLSVRGCLPEGSRFGCIVTASLVFRRRNLNGQNGIASCFRVANACKTCYISYHKRSSAKRMTRRGSASATADQPCSAQMICFDSVFDGLNWWKSRWLWRRELRPDRAKIHAELRPWLKNGAQITVLAKALETESWLWRAI